MTYPTHLLVGGKFQDASSGRTFTTVNPATEEPLAEVAEADAADVDLAVEAARRAFTDKAWSRMAARDRAKLLWKVGDLIPQNADARARR
jgi:acyl-CoA reductase-like NAD-dependent aldehyde dehydrogenase